MNVRRPQQQSHQPRPMKALFQRNGLWSDILDTEKLRPIEIEVVTRMLACATPLMGTKEYSWALSHLLLV